MMLAKLTRWAAAIAVAFSVTAAGPAICRAEDKPKEKPRYTEGSCCDKAAKAGKECTHPCCAEAAKEGKVCAKCNKPAEGK